MTGCLALPFRLLAMALLVGLLYFGWTERDRIAPLWHQLVDHRAGPGAGATGRAGSAALAHAQGKIDSLNGWRADSVVLTPSEMASLVGAGLDARVRGELDSLSVTLGDHRLSVAGRIRTAGLPRVVLGPLAGALDEREPVRAAGTVTVVAPGLAAWAVDEFMVRDFPFPREMVPRIVGLVTGKRDGGVVTIAIPAGIGGVRVHPDGVTLYPSDSQP
jgi:hypothetical protein